MSGTEPLPLGPLFEVQSGRGWPAFWDVVVQQDFPGVGVLVDGRPLTMDVAPVQRDGRTLVPMRAIFEALGAQVGYDPATRQITATKDQRRVVLWQGDSLARVDARLTWLDVPPVEEGGRTLVPVRFVSEALGASVEWTAATRTVVVHRAPGRLTALPPELLGHRKVAYLTFDDGPSRESTAGVLDILAKYGVKATFFVVGRNVEAYPELVSREVKEGHALGNHTYDHDFRRAYRSPEAFLEDVQQGEEAINRAAHVQPRLLRAPGGTAGNFTPAYFELLDRQGYAVFDWNVSTADSAWPRPSPERMLANVAAYSYEGSLRHVIVLMHDGPGHRPTVEALPGIIGYLVQQGYLLRPLDPASPLAR